MILAQTYQYLPREMYVPMRSYSCLAISTEHVWSVDWSIWSCLGL